MISYREASLILGRAYPCPTSYYFNSASAVNSRFNSRSIRLVFSEMLELDGFESASCTGWFTFSSRNRLGRTGNQTQIPMVGTKTNFLNIFWYKNKKTLAFVFLRE